jgi:hypothetical protein
LELQLRESGFYDTAREQADPAAGELIELDEGRRDPDGRARNYDRYRTGRHQSVRRERFAMI